jgi:GntR family transcriptional regulator
MTQSVILPIQIATGDPRPVFRQIVDDIRKLIATGKLVAGDKLPSVRGLAMQLTVNANTVAKAYGELTNQGLIGSRKGLGVFVLEPQQRLNQQEQQHRLTQATEHFVNQVMYLDFDHQQIVEVVLAQLKQLKTTSGRDTISSTIENEGEGHE